MNKHDKLRNSNKQVHKLYYALSSMVSTVRAHGIDISRYQLSFDPALASEPLDFVIQRAGYGITKDPLYDTLHPGVMRVGIRGAYHYLWSNLGWQEQADAYLSIVGNDYHFHVADFEGAMSVSFGNLCWNWIQYIRQQTGKPVLLYTGYYQYRDYLMCTGHDWNSVPLWIAQYPVIPNPSGTPSIPPGRNGWQMWQYTSAGRGSLYGAGSANVDLNVWNGTVEEMRNYFGIAQPLPGGGAVTLGKAREKLGKTGTIREKPSRYGRDTGSRVFPYSTVDFSAIMEAQILGTADKPGEKWLKLGERRFVNYKLYSSSVLRDYFSILSMPAEQPSSSSGVLLRRVRKWGDDIMVRDLAASVKLIGSTNFQVVPLYCPEEPTWSATTKWQRLERSDVDALASLQYDDPDWTIKQKMNWLIYSGKHVRPMWCDGLGDWDTAPYIRAGVQVWGGQWVEVSARTYQFRTSYPNDPTIKYRTMRRVTPFCRADWGKSHATHPHLINRATAAGNNDVYIDAPRGTIYVPACFSPSDFLLYGRIPVEAWYIPDEWLEA